LTDPLQEDGKIKTFKIRSQAKTILIAGCDITDHDTVSGITISISSCIDEAITVDIDKFDIPWSNHHHCTSILKIGLINGVLSSEYIDGLSYSVPYDSRRHKITIGIIYKIL